MKSSQRNANSRSLKPAVIKLSVSDSQKLIDLLVDPAPPSASLRRVAEDYKSAGITIHKYQYHLASMTNPL